METNEKTPLPEEETEAVNGGMVIVTTPSVPPMEKPTVEAIRPEAILPIDIVATSGAGEILGANTMHAHEAPTKKPGILGFFKNLFGNF